jgi:RimJ/RimL family protein N-acetyltransferase
MRREGVLRKTFPLGGVLHDTEVWAVLAEDWRPAGSAARDRAGTPARG